MKKPEIRQLSGKERWAVYNGQIRNPMFIRDSDFFRVFHSKTDAEKAADLIYNTMLELHDKLDGMAVNEIS